MAQTENILKHLKKENLISLVLSLQNDRDKVIDTLGQRIDNLTSTVGNLSSKLAQVESSLVVTETVNKELLKRITKNSTVEESVWRLSVYTPSVDDKNLRSTVCNTLDDINVVCDSSDIEDCHWIKGNRTIIKFSSRRKSSEVLNKKKKVKNLDIGKYGFNDGSRIYNQSQNRYILWKF